MLPRFVEPESLMVETTGKTALDELNALTLLQQQGYDLQQYHVIDYRPTPAGTYHWIIEKNEDDA